ncbi:MAG: SPOR domain-containing protein [Treponema sp.]|jgi:hypothetical protein|nr:SPOR domain-containing protein [Treponema sp.]
MRKRIALLIALSLFTVTVLSSWEGAAAVAPEGELPAVGFFIATNSFPRNIVVDITNLETNKTTRAIVANELDNPGLLAIISREAAELIGMRRGSISTIKIVQPTEPVAYLRFAEGAASGTPYYSSSDVITEDTYKPPVQEKESPVGMTGPSYVLEPEWRARSAAPYIPGTPADYSVSPIPAEKKDEPPAFIAEPAQEKKDEELPVYITEPVPVEKTEEPPAQVTELVPEKTLEEPSVQITEPVPVEKVEEPPAQVTEPVPVEKVEEPPAQVTEPVPVEKVEEPPAQVAEPVPVEKVEEPPAQVAEPVPVEKVEEPPAQVAEPVPVEKVEEPPAHLAQVVPEKKDDVLPPLKEFILTPAEERPPENTTPYDIDPSKIIPGIRPAPAEEKPPEITNIDPAYIIPGIKPAPPEEKHPPENTIYGIDPSKIIPGITTAPPAKEPEKPVLPPFIDKITKLERGCYYVQIASYDNLESVENALKQIDRRYSPVIYMSNDTTYCILLGPLNQGESAAILQRFKSIGYKKAFIRHE